MTQNLYIFLAFALAVIGGGMGSTLAKSHRRLCALISLGAGTLFGVTVFGILPESVESLRWWGLLLALGSGYVVFVLITKYVYHVCPACAASHFDEATRHRFSDIATAMMVALAIHCTADGLWTSPSCWRFVSTKCPRAWRWAHCSLGLGLAASEQYSAWHWLNRRRSWVVSSVCWRCRTCRNSGWTRW